MDRSETVQSSLSLLLSLKLKAALSDITMVVHFEKTEIVDVVAIKMN